ncbi:hypothetical protein MANES_11G043001v8 [Manihot esculenta]|uniref:Uncharacterized protein n=1 Tax=Manihot esculenta TaxID=3983 RepID=A0ACB7GV22_MANES|nr:hypothetical protein MANES_11G043001v8 [Manihot esculenta]
MASRWGMNRADRRTEARDRNESGSSPEKSRSRSFASDNYKGLGPKPYSYDELAFATGHFSLNNQLGQGGFGQVFKASLDGKIRAVKKLNNFPDVQSEGDLEREIMVVNRVSHKNLVRLVGYCVDGANRLLILKYFPNKSLKYTLHRKENVLDWKKRMNIAIGSARGLEYLHEHCKPNIIHLDIKPDNIFLDNHFEPKISDFGLALFFKDAATHVSRSSTLGTHIYADPLSTKLGKYSDKSDIYSFGVTLLELITGRNPMIDKSTDIITWANPLIEKALKGEYADFVDSRLQSFDHEEMHRMILCANTCINQPPKSRPSMKMILLALERTLPLENLWNVKNDNKLRSGASYKAEVTPYYTKKEDVNDFDEYDPTKYESGYDIAMTYGHPIPPSEETCYPNSSSADEIFYNPPHFTSDTVPSAYTDDRLQEEYTSYARPKPRPRPACAFNFGGAPGGEVFVAARPQPTYVLQPGRTMAGSDYGSGSYDRRPDYEKPLSEEYGSGYGRRRDYEYGYSGYGRRTEYERQHISEYGYGYQGRTGFEYGSGYGGRIQSEYEDGGAEYGRWYGRKPSYEVEGGYRGRPERTTYEMCNSDGGEEGYGRKKYGEDDSDDEEKKHQRYKNHHRRKHYDDE